MKGSQKNPVIRISESDNVGIASGEDGLHKGIRLENGVTVIQHIPMGHKVALVDIDKGESIVRYGHAIGFAAKAIRAGEWVNGSNILQPIPSRLKDLPLQNNLMPEPEPLTGYTFMGYRNKDGSAGTRNVLGILTSVQCVSGFAAYVVEKIKKELLPSYPNVDDVVALNHTYGCGVAIDSPSAVIPVRTLKNIARNPNFGDEVMVIGLGCEKLKPESLLSDDVSGQNKDSNGFQNLTVMQDETLHGFAAMAGQIIKNAEIFLKRLDQRRREVCPASELVVGMQCGGSDAFSGMTANPAVGFASDLIVRAGGSVMFSEVTEVRDAVHLLLPRTKDSETGKALLREMEWYDNYLSLGMVDSSANPAPGNKMGGLSNIVEKALGSVAKSGTSPIVDVIGPGERIRRKGLTFAATPASDFICGTLQVAAGMNMHVFTTGRGTPYGLSMVPVIKVGSNSKLSKRWHDLIDLDAGPIASGEKSIGETGWELFHLILDVASGTKTVACDKLGLHNDLVLFNPGPVT